MTNEEILREAIEKAVKNGYNPIKDMGAVDNFDINRTQGHWKGLWISYETKRGDGGQEDITRMLFDHDFAKAFWGEKDCCPYCGSTGATLWCGLDGFDCGKCNINLSNKKYAINWQYHLQQMVIEPEPLKYLEKFINVKGE